MRDTDILNFDSPWAAVLEGAEGGPDVLPPTAQRDLLTEEELTALTGSPEPVLLLRAEGAPPAFDDIYAPNPERSAYFRQLAEVRGWSVVDLLDWGSVGRSQCSQVCVYVLPIDHPRGAQLLRRDSSFGDEYNFTPPLRHRLEGDRIPVLALIILADRSAGDYSPFVDRRANPADSLLCSQLHEMFHQGKSIGS